MAGRFVLDLRTRQAGPNTLLIDGFPHKCGACGIRYFTARELIKHMNDEREKENSRD
jgi:hypothetical protein